MTDGAPLLSALVGDAEIAALFQPAAELEAMVEFEIELADAEADVGIIEAGQASAIASALRDFQPDTFLLAEGLRRDGVCVPELVRQLRRAVGEPHGSSIHLGATSQDVVDTGLMLRLRKVFGLLDEHLVLLLDVLDRLAREQGRRPLMAHTRMQGALPFTVEDKIRSWAMPLRLHAERLITVRKNLAVQLGGPIGDGSTFKGKERALRAALARRLGLANAEPWHSDRTRILDLAHSLALVTGTLGKIGQDVALMAQSEVAAIELAGGGSSSAMAHKHNPVGAEVLVALARFNAGLAGTLQHAMIHENERSGAAWTLEWLVLPQMAESAGSALRHALALLDDATIG